MRAYSIKQIIAYSMILVLLLLCSACGPKTQENGTPSVYYYPTNSTAETQNTQETQQEFALERYLVLAVDGEEEQLTVYSYATGKEYVFLFGLYTELIDAYGKRASFAKMQPGEVCYLIDVDTDGRIRQMELASDVWRYEKVTRFAVDEENGIFTIADTKYSMDENLKVFAENGLIGVDELTENDTLTVIGQDKKLLSIVVTTGHGYLQLSNTELFEGSFLQLDTSYFVEITPDLSMELPEGKYLLSVANNGWGGSSEIDIVHGQTTTMDLDEIKGDGPQYGEVLFVSDTEGIAIKVDKKEIKPGETVALTYGKHTLDAQAEGYESWSKYLFVNSKEATITIALEKVLETSPNTTSPTTETTQTQATQKDSESTKDTSSQVNDDYLKDYLSTLTDLIGSF